MDEKLKEEAKEERKKLLELFPSTIYVEEIPNEYYNDAYGEIFPWFKVTTDIGHFKIGWRKRVIVLDWSQTMNKNNSLKLFPKEDVTKGEYSIHCWSHEKAKEYIDIIIKNITLPKAK